MAIAGDHGCLHFAASRANQMRFTRATDTGSEHEVVACSLSLVSQSAYAIQSTGLNQ